METLEPIVLYGHKGTPNPVKVQIVLEELGLPYVCKSVEITDMKKEPYLSVNPNGRVPAIEDVNTGVTMFESGAILRYLVDKYDDDKKLDYTSQHLTCFDGGNFILGGEALGRQDIIDFGLALVDGCHDTYISTVTGIGPEVFSWNTTNMPANQTAFYQKSGFWIVDGYYDLRPEVIESFYYAYRSTKDPKYQDWAWEGFQNINHTARANSGFSSFKNVNIAGGGAKDDNQESFLFAEVMKYSYLIHAEEAPYQVLHNGKNGWVFNTEAHPFKVAGKHV